ncbi:hypothetical protein DPMN_184731 [Dreissena polymorpha]|uniref:Uncharacterized protein n=1 Tax=Dreissena polymorpha TaxID=45954 RepID=A0A9D4DIG6_DREPO|nr:hypothetical protein DPMN_184731 [Dreissena polymorpha]
MQCKEVIPSRQISKYEYFVLLYIYYIHFYKLLQPFTDLEEFPEGDVIQTVGAVEDDALLGNGLGEILGGLSLTGSCRALRGATQMQLQGTKQGPGESAGIIFE